MAIEFIEEDGTGLSTATSYISLSDFNQYWENVGYTSTLSDDQKKVLLNKCTQVLDGMFGAEWPGYRFKFDTDVEQALDWPRRAAFTLDGLEIDDESVPQAVKNALCELAYIKNSGIDIQTTDSNVGITGESVKVGPISESKEYSSARFNTDARTAYQPVYDALKRYVNAPGKITGVTLV